MPRNSEQFLCLSLSTFDCQASVECVRADVTLLNGGAAFQIHRHICKPLLDERFKGPQIIVAGLELQVIPFYNFFFDADGTGDSRGSGSCRDGNDRELIEN